MFSLFNKNLTRHGAVSLGLEILILIVIALALLVVILFLISRGILSPIGHITNVTNTNVTIP